MRTTAWSVHLEGHKLVVGFRGPGIDLNAVLQSYHQELDPFIFHWKQTSTSLEAYTFKLKYTRSPWTLYSNCQSLRIRHVVCLVTYLPQYSMKLIWKCKQSSMEHTFCLTLQVEYMNIFMIVKWTSMFRFMNLFITVHNISSWWSI